MESPKKETGGVKRGDVILTAPPFAYIVNSNVQGFYCDYCLSRRTVLQRCSGCKITRYCNRECQTTSWEKHKKECINLKKIRPKVPPNTARFMARIISKLNEGGEDIEEKIDDKRSRKFDDLMDHYETIKDNPKRQEHFTSLCVVLKEYLGEENLPSSERLFRIYAKICINSFNITDAKNDIIGVGLYLSASIFNHSCDANAYASFNGPSVTIRALVNIPKLDLDKIYISYLDILNSTEERRQQLQDQYYFKCECSLCTNVQKDILCSSIKCGNSKCEVPVPIDITDDEDAPIVCPKCEFSEFKPDTRKEYYASMIYTKSILNDLKDRPILATIGSVISKQGMFHKANLWRVKTLDMAVEAAINKGSWDVARNFASENLVGIRFYYGATSPFFAQRLVVLAKIEMYLLHIPEAYRHLMDAKPILLKTHGHDHPVLHTVVGPLLSQAKQEMQLLEMTGGKKINL